MVELFFCQVFFISFYRKREMRREKVKKKIGGAGKTHFVSRKFLPEKRRRKRRVLVFNPPRGARTFHHTSKLYQSVSRQRIILILLLIRREHSDLI